MDTVFIFIWIYGAMIAMALWEAYSEGRNAWQTNKLGWKLKIGKNFILTAYHFYLFYVMIPLLLTLPFIAKGWNTKLFGIILSAYLSGIVLEDFFWYVFNPVVKFKEFWSEFSDYYPWIRIKRRKIVPVLYVIALSLAFLSWLLIWR